MLARVVRGVIGSLSAGNAYTIAASWSNLHVDGLPEASRSSPMFRPSAAHDDTDRTSLPKGEPDSIRVRGNNGRQ